MLRILPLLTAMLLCVSVCIDAPAQRRGTRKRARAPQTQAQPVPPEDVQTEKLIERDVANLRALSPADKAAVAAAITTVDRAVRLYKVKGFDKYMTYDYSPRRDQIQAVVTKAEGVLPDDSVTKSMLRGAWQAILDAHKVERGRFERGSITDAELLNIIDHYKLADAPEPVLAVLVLDQATYRITVASKIAVVGRIMPQPAP